MLERLFGGDGFLAKTHALDALSLRHQVISHNLANANTPNFKRQEVAFEAQLSKALEGKRDYCGRPLVEAVAQVQPKVVTINTTSSRTDGNNVDMEMENVNLATNTLRFQLLTQSVSGYFGSLKSVINGR